MESNKDEAVCNATGHQEHSTKECLDQCLPLNCPCPQDSLCKGTSTSTNNAVVNFDNLQNCSKDYAGSLRVILGADPAQLILETAEKVLQYWEKKNGCNRDSKNAKNKCFCWKSDLENSNNPSVEIIKSKSTLIITCDSTRENSKHEIPKRKRSFKKENSNHNQKSDSEYAGPSGQSDYPSSHKTDSKYYSDPDPCKDNCGGWSQDEKECNKLVCNGCNPKVEKSYSNDKTIKKESSSFHEKPTTYNNNKVLNYNYQVSPERKKDVCKRYGVNKTEKDSKYYSDPDPCKDTCGRWSQDEKECNKIVCDGCIPKVVKSYSNDKTIKKESSSVHEKPTTYNNNKVLNYNYQVSPERKKDVCKRYCVNKTEKDSNRNISFMDWLKHSKDHLCNPPDKKKTSYHYSSSKERYYSRMDFKKTSSRQPNYYNYNVSKQDFEKTIQSNHRSENTNKSNQNTSVQNTSGFSTPSPKSKPTSQSDLNKSSIYPKTEADVSGSNNLTRSDKSSTNILNKKKCEPCKECEPTKPCQTNEKRGRKCARIVQRRGYCLRKNKQCRCDTCRCQKLFGCRKYAENIPRASLTPSIRSILSSLSKESTFIESIDSVRSASIKSTTPVPSVKSPSPIPSTKSPTPIPSITSPIPIPSIFSEGETKPPRMLKPCIKHDSNKTMLNAKPCPCTKKKRSNNCCGSSSLMENSGKDSKDINCLEEECLSSCGVDFPKNISLDTCCANKKKKNTKKPDSIESKPSKVESDSEEFVDMLDLECKCKGDAPPNQYSIKKKSLSPEIKKRIRATLKRFKEIYGIIKMVCDDYHLKSDKACSSC